MNITKTIYCKHRIHSGFHGINLINKYKNTQDQCNYHIQLGQQNATVVPLCYLLLKQTWMTNSGVWLPLVVLSENNIVVDELHFTTPTTIFWESHLDNTASVTALIH